MAPPTARIPGRPSRSTPCQMGATPGPPSRSAPTPIGATQPIGAFAGSGPVGPGGSEADRLPGEVPAAAQEGDGARNGHPDPAGRDRLAPDPADPVEAWWLPSSITDRLEEPSWFPAPQAADA